MLGTIYILTWNFAEMKNMAYISFGFVRWILFGKISGLPKRLTGYILDINFCMYSVEQCGTESYTDTMGIRIISTNMYFMYSQFFKVFETGILLSNFAVDKNGDVCISILHEPGEDKYGYEKPEERWLPIHTVETIMISVISMLADPNGDSPANVDAAVRTHLLSPLIKLDLNYILLYVCVCGRVLIYLFIFIYFSHKSYFTAK